MQLRFDGKTALVTGATSGIGRATAELLAAGGAQLLITGRNKGVLAALAAQLNTTETTVVAVDGDISDSRFREQLIETLRSQFGALDVLVHSAGIIAGGTAETTAMTDYDQMMDVNLRSVIHLTQLSIPLLAASRGNVVNVSSVAGVRSFPNLMAYCISKAGLDQFTRCAALDLAPQGIRVNAVNPGVVRTELHKNSGMTAEDYDRFLAHSRSTHPIGRVGTAEEVAQLIAYLGSDAAGWISGVTYSIDGGRAQTCAR